MTQGDKAKPLGPMLYAGAYLTGGIVGYDSNTLSGGYGHRILGIGYSAQYRQDTVTVMLRLINVVSGEVELTVMTEKTILSVGAGKDKFKYLDLDTQLLEVEFGAALNEPVTYAVRKTIEGAVVELVRAGQKKGLWKFKAPEWKDPGVKIIETPTEDELLEEIIEIDDEIRTEVKEEVYDDYKKKPEDGSDGSGTLTEEDAKEILEELKEKDSEVEVEKPEIPKEVFTQKLLDELECGVNPHKLKCLEKSNETSNTSVHTPHTDR